MNTKKAIAIGCGAIVLIGIVLIVVIGLFVAHVVKGVEGVVVTVNSPTNIVVGQSFDLEVVVKNVRSNKALELSDIDIAEDYLSGFTITPASPLPKSSIHVPVDNSRSFTYDTSIPAGASKSFIFKMHAEKAGIYRGDVDVCEGTQFITTMAQTVVKEKE